MIDFRKSLRIVLLVIKSISILTLAISSTVTADWRDGADFSILQEYAGTTLVDGTGLSVSQTEAGTNYLPNSALGIFAGVSAINNLTNSSSGISSHSNNVGNRFYGSGLSLTQNISTVNVRSATDFINNFIGSFGQVDSSSDIVMSHAYIFSPGADDPDTVEDENAEQTTLMNEYVRRFDFFSQNSNIMNVVGLNNGSGTDVPPGWAASYNSISVGRLNGAHSRGGTPDDFESPGRLKPDIVVDETATSWATGAISSSASLLYQKAEEQSNLDATHPDTIKAGLLAGATKAEFSDWSQTTTQPLDPIFGAGEVNIFNSYRIIEQTESAEGSVFYRGWARNSTNVSQTRTYTFTTPDFGDSVTLSTALIWQRSVTETMSGVFFFTTYTYAYEDLADLKLELLDGSGNLVQESDSALDNVEHIWNPTLAANTTYSLRVSSSSGASDFSLAWRVEGDAGVELAVTFGGTEATISSSNLVPNIDYTVQRSTDLEIWEDLGTITPVTVDDAYVDSSLPSGGRAFYRFRYFLP